jgi:hypothetical protein
MTSVQFLRPRYAGFLMGFDAFDTSHEAIPGTMVPWSVPHIPWTRSDAGSTQLCEHRFSGVDLRAANVVNMPVLGQQRTAGCVERPNEEEIDMRKTVLFVCSAVVALAACGKNKMVEAAEIYEKEACACKDVQCTTAATTKFSEATTKNATSVPTSGGDAEAYTKAVGNATACVTKAAMSGIPGMPGMPGTPAKK